MNLLLDTHALIWWLQGSELDPKVREQIADPETLVVVSAVSVWEAAIKQAIGKLEVPEPLGQAALDEGFEPLAVNFDHAELAGSLPLHHCDPFDRMIIAQAQHENLGVVTRDTAFEAYEVKIVRC